MTLQYKAVFIIPIKTKMKLTDVGWELETKTFLPDSVIGFLTNNLKLHLDETYLGIKGYINECLQAGVFLDDLGRIEHVSHCCPVNN